MKHRATVNVEVEVAIEWEDDSVNADAATPGGDRNLYGFLGREHVFEHLAFNAVRNGRRDGRMLFGWADTDRTQMRREAEVIDAFFESEVLS